MMANSILILTSIVFGVITAEYVGPQNGNGNSYGVPTDSISPPQGPSGPYPPSGWKPAGRRLLLPGESRSAQQPIDSGYGQPPPSQYGPVNPPPINNQYGPSVDSTGPPNNQYIPGSGPGGFGNGGNGGNGFSNGNGHNGNGNGNGHNGNGNGFNGNGNGHNGNGNGHNGNGNGHNGNGNGHNGNGNGFGNGNGNGHNGNGNGNGNGFSNGNGHNGGNGFANGGNGHNGNGNGNGGSNGNGNGNGNGKGGNGANGLVPAFHSSFPGGLIYPFVQHSVPALLAFRPGNGAGAGNIYPIFQVPISHSSPGTGIIASSFPNNVGTGQGVIPVTGAFPSFQTASGTPDLSAAYPGIQVTGTNDVAAAYPGVVSQGGGLYGTAVGQHYTLISNPHSHNSNLLGINNGLTNLPLQHAVGHSPYGHGGVPLGVF